jgi:hypothetical protein
MPKYFVAAALLLSLIFSINAFSQSQFGTVTGNVSDSSGALIPGVTIKATATETGVVSTTISNETGAYNFGSLLPGKYTFAASLTGLTTQTITDAEISANQTYRYNFKMTVSSSATTVDVSVSAQNMIAQSGATVGQALTEQKVHDLPLVGNNVLNLLSTLSGVERLTGTNDGFGQNNAFSREAATLAGVSAQNVPTVRDGVIVSDTRYPTGINGATVMNPDLVGEVRLILAPVDAELGRGNGTIQITTRSGTNKYTGSAVWTIRNSALNPNTWVNNTNRTLVAGTPAFQPDGTPTKPSATPVNWNNTNQATVSFGGPIIKNKTFFFALYDRNQALQRSSTNFVVLTPCARQGIFRYFDGWNANNALATTVSTGGTPSIASVNLDGTPANITTQPNGSPSSLQARSVFGTLTNAGNVNADCSGAAINPGNLVPTGAAAGWDPNRVALDSTGFINRTLAFMPLPNNYEIGDGLNTAGFRWLRHNTGLDNLFSIGEDTGNRSQINVKIDHNFNQKHKANFNISYERVHSDDVYQGWPGTFSNENYHRPLVITSAFTSTLSANVLNEARFGYKVTGTNVIAPWSRPELQDQINAYDPADVNGIRVLARAGGALSFCYPITGARPPGGCGANAALTAYATDHTPSYTYGDTLSWTKGNHAMKFGYELRENDSTSQVNTVGFFSNFGTEVQAVGGSAPGAPQSTAGGTGINNTNPAFTTLGTTTAGTARNVLDFLAGSMSSINQLYWITNPANTTSWSDYRTEHFLTIPLHQTEMSAFAKDDYKVTKTLTLNLGVRWEYYGVPYNTRGISVSPVGGSDAIFGISGRSFDNFWAPPAIGSQGTNTAAGYDPNLVTKEQFVGPNSPNSGTKMYPNDLNNFGPSVGFSWQVPFWGEGKTTVRGGYQITYQGGGRFSTIEPVISAPPGSTTNATYADPNNLYLDLTDLNVPGVIPVPPTVSAPMGTIRVTDRTQAVSVFDSHYTTPYVQNLTMTVTRQVSRNLQVDARYIGTLAVKQYRTLGQFDTANFTYNGLAAQLDSIRQGGESTMLDQMFNGINLCVTGCGAGTFGAIGTTVGGVPQTAAQQMRSSTTFQSNLALGNYSAIASTLNTLNYIKAAPGAACTTGAAGNCGLPDLPTGTAAVTGAAMRFSGLFPENFFVNNPQYGSVNYLTNLDHSNYHSMQLEGTYRPIQGISLQGTYTWSKNLGSINSNPLFGGATGYTDPTRRYLDYTIVNGNRTQEIRTNGTFELPMGPNKLMFGNSSGAFARAIERWQLGVIYNYNTGSYSSVGAQSMLYGNGVPDVVQTPFTDAALKALQSGNVTWNTRIPTGYEGRYFGDQFGRVDDPQCANVTSLQNLNGLAVAGGVRRCTLSALAYIVPDGTPGAIPVVDTIQVDNPASPGNTISQTRTRSGVIVLQNPVPGTQGNLGQSTIRTMGTYNLDTTLGKQFRITESKSVQIRIDTTNVLNHPTPGAPQLSINANNNPFGQITTKSGGRAFQGQVRFNF